MDLSLLNEYLLKSYGGRNKKGFAAMREVLAVLGNPHEKLRIIHVAGTNGKGSTCMYLTSILLHAGNRIGTFVSPHLIKYNERFLIDGEQITDAELARQVGLVKDAINLVLGRDEIMSFFEIFTIVCYNYFSEQNVDYAIIETGLGGRLDPTNVIEDPLLSIITSIGYDHMNILGEEIEQIASEKAGIIKKSRPSVLYSNQNPVYNTIKNKAEQMASELYYSQGFDINILSKSLEGTRYSAKIGQRYYNDVNISLSGDYQVYNSSNVIYSVRILKSVCGLDIGDDALFSGLQEAIIFGRMEIIDGDPLIVLDGAHNTDAVRELVKSCDDYFLGKDIYLVMGTLSDKEYARMVADLSAVARTVVYTMPDNTRAADPADLIRYNSPKAAAYIEPDSIKAFELARGMAGDGDIVIVAGSLYLVGTIRKHLKTVYDTVGGKLKN